MDWLILSLIGALLLALSEIVQKKVLRKEKVLEFTILLYFFGFLILAALSYDFRFSELTYFEYGIIICRGLLASLGIYFFGKALQRADISFVSPMMNFSVIFLILFSFIFIGETLSIIEILGVFLIMIGAYIIQLNPKMNLTDPIKNIRRSKAVHYLILTMIFYSLATLLEKYFFNHVSVATNHFLMISYFSSLVFFFSIYFFQGFRFKNLIKSSKEHAPLVAVFSVFDVSSTLFHIKAVSLQGSKVSLIIPIRRMSTLVDVAIGGTFFHEKNLWIKTIGTAIMILGVVLVVI